MSDYLKKGFLLGLGAAISGKEKLEKKLKELVDKNELSQEQAKTVMQNFIDKGDLKTGEWSSKQKDQVKKTASDFGLATKEEVEELRLRIIELESKFNEKEE
ncbi:hypothetical protein D8M04_14940 [Oceanobacillus piezotolerans]|uniref:Polyhydroxyalkanoate synthesis regulator n=1 Tax=Oceanobacillus piezotolerans TaxID=2448030 RepID=A0A498D3S3_9BACI|nr:hypothetical protein [Oceanobacillus piezotolerans]RLL42842.1 hypothetical protein D8M04_14940 [Oceanobacillus piezotolerans]